MGDARAGGAVLAQTQAQDSGVHLAAVGVDGQVLERLEVAGEIQKQLAAGLVVVHVLGDHDVVHQGLNLPGDRAIGQLALGAYQGHHVLHANRALVVQGPQIGEHTHIGIGEVGNVRGDIGEPHVAPDAAGRLQRNPGTLRGLRGGVAAAVAEQGLFEGAHALLGAFVPVDIVLGEVLQNLEVEHLGFGAHAPAGRTRRSGVARFPRRGFGSVVVRRAHNRYRSFLLCRMNSSLFCPGLRHPPGH